MRNISSDMQKNAPITHCMTVHKKRIAIIYFIFILKCQFSICACLSRWRIAVTRIVLPLRYMRHMLRAAANWRSARNRSMRQSTAVG